MNSSASCITQSPVSESRRITRERLFRLPHLRSDFRDVITIFVLLLQSWHDDKFTGSVLLNFSQGSVNSVKVTDSKTVTPS